MFNDAFMFDNSALFAQPFFFIATITKFLCEGDNVILKKNMIITY